MLFCRTLIKRSVLAWFVLYRMFQIGTLFIRQWIFQQDVQFFDAFPPISRKISHEIVVVFLQGQIGCNVENSDIPPENVGHYDRFELRLTGAQVRSLS